TPSRTAVRSYVGRTTRSDQRRSVTGTARTPVSCRDAGPAGGARDRGPGGGDHQPGQGLLPAARPHQAGRGPLLPRRGGGRARGRGGSADGAEAVPERGRGR